MVRRFQIRTRSEATPPKVPSPCGWRLPGSNATRSDPSMGPCGSKLPSSNATRSDPTMVENAAEDTPAPSQTFLWAPAWCVASRFGRDLKPPHHKSLPHVVRGSLVRTRPRATPPWDHVVRSSRVRMRLGATPPWHLYCRIGRYARERRTTRGPSHMRAS